MGVSKPQEDLGQSKVESDSDTQRCQIGLLWTLFNSFLEWLVKKKKKTGQLFTFSRETGLTLLRIIISKRLLGKSTVLPLKKSKPMVQKPANTFYFQKHFYFSQNTSVCIKKIILINCIIILTPIWWNFF